MLAFLFTVNSSSPASALIGLIFALGGSMVMFITATAQIFGVRKARDCIRPLLGDPVASLVVADDAPLAPPGWSGALKCFRDGMRRRRPRPGLLSLEKNPAPGERGEGGGASRRTRRRRRPRRRGRRASAERRTHVLGSRAGPAGVSPTIDGISDTTFSPSITRSAQSAGAGAALRSSAERVVEAAGAARASPSRRGSFSFTAIDSLNLASSTAAASELRCFFSCETSCWRWPRRRRVGGGRGGDDGRDARHRGDVAQQGRDDGLEQGASPPPSRFSFRAPAHDRASRAACRRLQQRRLPPLELRGGARPAAAGW